MIDIKRATLIFAAFASALAQKTPSGQSLGSGLVQQNAPSLAVGGGITTSTVLMAGSGGTWVVCGPGVFGCSVDAGGLKPEGPPVTLKQVKLSTALINKERLPSSTYLEAAASIGLNSAATDEAKILQTIDRLGLTVYDFGKVNNYLYHEAKKQGQYVEWVWKPLRDRDHDWIRDNGDGGALRRSRAGGLDNSVYGNLIPESVLGKAAVIMAALPDVMFLVSDYESVKPDPFLAITTIKLFREGKVWIVEQWDEPGFGAAPVKSVPVIQPVASAAPSSLKIHGTPDNPGTLASESGDLKISADIDGTLHIEAGPARQ